MNPIAVFEAMFFSEIQTGGGCTALAHGFDASTGNYILITDGDAEAPTADSLTFSVGIYRADGHGEDNTVEFHPDMDIGQVLPLLAKHLKNDGVVLRDGIACYFAQALEQDLTAEQFAEIKRLNATPEYSDGICASHNYCDANVFMLEAFEAFGLSAPEDSDEPAVAIWNGAWEFASKEFLQ